MMSIKANIIFLIVVLFITLEASSQDARLFYLEIEPNQQVEMLSGAPGSSVNVPVRSGVVLLDGAHDSEGLGQAIVFNGSRLIIDSSSIGEGGWRYVVLRREDGRNFYDMFPTLKARMIPTTQRPAPEKKKDSSQFNRQF